MNKKIFLLILFTFIAGSVLFSPAGSALTFETLKQHREAFLLFVQTHYLLSVLLFAVIYIMGTGLSLPGAAVFSMSGGFLFGAIAPLYVNISATTGAALSFLTSRYLVGTALQERYKIHLTAFNEEMKKHGARYLITLRFIPVIPFFLINVLSGLTRIPLRTFLWTTSLGIIPSNILFTNAGRQIGSINSPAEVFSLRVLIAFGLLALLPIAPVIIRKITTANDNK